MTEEELFVFLLQSMGPPKPLKIENNMVTAGKGYSTQTRTCLDYLCEFMAGCGIAGRAVKTESELKALHARWLEWWIRKEESK